MGAHGKKMAGISLKALRKLQVPILKFPCSWSKVFHWHHYITLQVASSYTAGLSFPSDPPSLSPPDLFRSLLHIKGSPPPLEGYVPTSAAAHTYWTLFYSRPRKGTQIVSIAVLSLPFYYLFLLASQKADIFPYLLAALQSSTSFLRLITRSFQILYREPCLFEGSDYLSSQAFNWFPVELHTINTIMKGYIPHPSTHQGSCYIAEKNHHSCGAKSLDL